MVIAQAILNQLLGAYNNVNTAIPINVVDKIKKFNYKKYVQLVNDQ